MEALIVKASLSTAVINLVTAILQYKLAKKMKEDILNPQEVHQAPPPSGNISIIHQE